MDKSFAEIRNAHMPCLFSSFCNCSLVASVAIVVMVHGILVSFWRTASRRAEREGLWGPAMASDFGMALGFMQWKYPVGGDKRRVAGRWVAVAAVYVASTKAGDDADDGPDLRGAICFRCCCTRNSWASEPTWLCTAPSKLFEQLVFF